MQYLYQEGELYFLMDTENYEQMSLEASHLSDVLPYLLEGMSLQVSFYKESPVGVELPTAVELTVAETGPSFKGDTATGGTKPATMETGLTLQVPVFVNTGDKIKVDTRTAEYLERA
jgi:elongation factor P